MPINPSSLTRWRQRIGEKGAEKILAATVKIAKSTGKITEKECTQVIADTTVMEKAITHPTDSKLLNRAREKLVELAKAQGLVLRQTYTRVGRTAFSNSCRYGHAGQYKRMAKQVKKLTYLGRVGRTAFSNSCRYGHAGQYKRMAKQVKKLTYLGRVVRDVERKAGENVKAVFQELLEKANRLLVQTKGSPRKLCSLHAPEVECILQRAKLISEMSLAAKCPLSSPINKDWFCLPKSCMIIRAEL